MLCWTAGNVDCRMGLRANSLQPIVFLRHVLPPVLCPKKLFLVFPGRNESAPMLGGLATSRFPLTLAS